MPGTAKASTGKSARKPGTQTSSKRKSPSRKVIVLYEGRCGICSWLADWASERIHPDTTVDFVAFPNRGWKRKFPGVDPEDAAQTLHVRTGKNIRTGAHALAYVLLSMRDPWFQFGVLLNQEPVLLVAEPIYRFLARRRDDLSRLFKLERCVAVTHQF